MASFSPVLLPGGVTAVDIECYDCGTVSTFIPGIDTLDGAGWSNLPRGKRKYDTYARKYRTAQFPICSACIAQFGGPK